MAADTITMELITIESSLALIDRDLIIIYPWLLIIELKQKNNKEYVKIIYLVYNLSI